MVGLLINDQQKRIRKEAAVTIKNLIHDKLKGVHYRILTQPSGEPPINSPSLGCKNNHVTKQAKHMTDIPRLELRKIMGGKNPIGIRKLLALTAQCCYY
jgi:hypothetical protein